MASSIDSLDKRIILSLYEDVRASYKGIATRLGVSHNTVRARIERMLGDGVIRFAVVTNPPKVGLAVTAYLGISVDAQHLEQVSQTLADKREISYLGHTVGDVDILALVHFEGNAALFRFVHAIGQMEGVNSVRTTICCETVKGLPDRQVPMIHQELQQQEDLPAELRRIS